MYFKDSRFAGSPLVSPYDLVACNAMFPSIQLCMYQLPKHNVPTLHFLLMTLKYNGSLHRTDLGDIFDTVYIFKDYFSAFFLYLF